MMKRNLIIGVTLAGLAAVLPAQAQTDACQAARRELAYGQAATEDAKDQQGFLRAAQEFEKAVKKAPNCAAAYFNLGLVSEKGDRLSAAKSAYERYLKLDPKAPDAASVEQLIFKLEYRIKRVGQNSRLDENFARRLQGSWGHPKTRLGVPFQDQGCSFDYYYGYLIDFEISGTKVKGIVVARGVLDTTTCTSHYSPMKKNVPFLEATIKNGRMIGEQCEVTNFPDFSYGCRGAAWRFEWKINMAPDGQRFTIDIIAGKAPKPLLRNQETTVFLRR
ncbi:MAG: hypothetical protein O3B76_02820 [Proteobacteria bacterium]|nr:hypothetical protein [Pseudomonadota bacterium]MDA1022088.1 hypothetical protein [Pseudomonadota bacterium]